MTIPGQFYDAEIKMDVILSHPWLKEHELGVLPFVFTLAMGKSFDPIVWVGRKRPKGRLRKFQAA